MAYNENPHKPPDEAQPRDLWQTALATLDDELRSKLDFKKFAKQDVVRRALKTAEEKKQICLKKRWRFERHGKQVVVRDVLEKIIKWLDAFKAVGDVAVQYNPSHASLPWAAVRFLLQVAVTDTHVFSETVEGLENVAHIISRYAIFESVHVQRKTAADAEIEPVLSDLYAEILTYLAKSMKYFEMPTRSRSQMS